MVLAGGYSKVRGIRNNNPGNLKHSDDQWLGLRPVQTDPTFFQFQSAEYGIRAMARTLLTYQRRHGLDTVQDIIMRWAPKRNEKGEIENDTLAYIKSVAQRMGVNPDDRISVEYYLESLVKAIIVHENGFNPYSDETIREGLALV